MLHGIGFFIASLTDDELPAPQELVGTDERLERVANYLDGGLVHETYRGFSWCRFRCGVRHVGHRELTDGVWAWPEGLSHYLRHHSVRLPEEFIIHALQGKSRVQPPKEETGNLQRWCDWSRPLRCAELRNALAAARLEAARHNASQENVMNGHFWCLYRHLEHSASGH